MLDWLDAVPHAALIAAVAAIVGLESIGLPLPGETVLVGSVLIAVHDGIVPWGVFLAAVAGAIVGDNIGYLIGHYFGIHVLELGRRRLPAAFSTRRIEGAARLMARYGAWAVFFARFVALLRILGGPLAGTLRMHYWRFLLANSAGAIVWAGGVTLVVAALGAAAEDLLHRASWVALAIVGVLVVAGIVLLVLRRRRRARDPEGAAAEDEDERTIAELLEHVQRDVAARRATPAADGAPQALGRGSR